MRRTMLLLVVFTGACASGGTSTPAPEAQTVRVSGAGGQTTLGLRSSGPDQRSDTIWTPVPDVWRQMPAVYAALEIPISDVDPAKHVIGTTGFKAYRRLGKTALSKLIDCGRTQIGQNADSYEIHLSIMSNLSSIGENGLGTSVITTVQAFAKPIQFPGEFFPCRSTGQLETQMALAIKARAAP